MLVTAGLWDPRVAYWEPTKWVQTLRHHQRQATAQENRETAKRQSAIDPAPLLLKMDMDAGHFSASDRYKHLDELAFGWTFLLDRLGMTTVSEGTSRSRKIDL